MKVNGCVTLVTGANRAPDKDSLKGFLSLEHTRSTPPRGDRRCWTSSPRSIANVSFPYTLAGTAASFLRWSAVHFALGARTIRQYWIQ